MIFLTVFVYPKIGLDPALAVSSLKALNTSGGSLQVLLTGQLSFPLKLKLTVRLKMIDFLYCIMLSSN